MKIDPTEVRDYLINCGPDSKVYIGADSKRIRIGEQTFVDYMLVVVVHINGRNGCKIFGEVQREAAISEKLSRPAHRLMTEVYKVSELYERLADAFIEAETFDVEIHLDLNPNEMCGSSVVINQAIGYIRGTCNINPVVKPDAFAASYAADRFKDIKNHRKIKVAA